MLCATFSVRTTAPHQARARRGRTVLVATIMLLGGCNSGPDSARVDPLDGAWEFRGGELVWRGHDFVAAASGTRTWLFEEGGTALQLVDGAWVPAPGPSSDDVVAAAVASNGEVVVATAGQDLYRDRDGSWVLVASDIGLEPELLAVDGEAWVAAAGGVVLAHGQKVLLDFPAIDLWVSGEQVWVAGKEYGLVSVAADGSVTTVLDERIEALCGTGSGDVWALASTYGRYAHHFDGEAWSLVDGIDGIRGDGNGFFAPRRAWCASDGQVWAIYRPYGGAHPPDSFWRFDGDAWAPLELESGFGMGRLGAVGPLSHELVGYASDRVGLFDGTRVVDASGDGWFALEEDPDGAFPSTAVVDGALWARIDGWSKRVDDGWEPLDLPRRTRFVTGTEENLWALTDDPVFTQRRHAGHWDDWPIPVEEIHALTAVEGWVFAGGTRCEVFAADTTKDEVPEPTGIDWPCGSGFDRITAMAGRTPDDVWAIARPESLLDDTAFLHWDGAAWDVSYADPLDPPAAIVDGALFLPSDDASRRSAWAHQGARGVDRAVHDGLLWTLEFGGTTACVWFDGECHTFDLPGARYTEIVSTGGDLWAIGDSGQLARWTPAD